MGDRVVVGCQKNTNLHINAHKDTFSLQSTNPPLVDIKTQSILSFLVCMLIIILLNVLILLYVSRLILSSKCLTDISDVVTSCHLSLRVKMNSFVLVSVLVFTVSAPPTTPR